MPVASRTVADIQIGRYRLCRRSGGRTWSLRWWDRASGASHRRSLGLTDLIEARLAAAQYVMADLRTSHYEHRERRDALRDLSAIVLGDALNAAEDQAAVDTLRQDVAQMIAAQRRPSHGDPRDLSVIEALVPYLEQHTDGLPSGPVARISARHLRDVIGIEATVADLTPARQREIIMALARRGHAPGYISRTMSVLSAAIGHARRDGVIMAAPLITLSRDRIAAIIGAPDEHTHRRLDIADLAAMVSALGDTRRSAHLHRYVILALNTLGRPDAVCDLTRAQIDHEMRVIDLNPAGRRQTKKRRPVVPMTATLAAWLTAWDAEDQDHSLPLVCHRGRPVANPKRGIRSTAIRARLMAADDWSPERSVVPYTLRRSMARLLRTRGVPLDDLAALLGHKSRAHGTTEIYADVEPAQMHRARTAIDGIMAEIAARGGPIMPCVTTGQSRANDIPTHVV
ncbi:tyrosine-type recombinase/integrase [Tistrella bauzanensis]|uniref:tyrosine-type recombinase/integrase n=1 Tax=Tistrella TaxID=171436 RepID=UPI0031F608F1